MKVNKRNKIEYTKESIQHIEKISLEMKQINARNDHDYRNVLSYQNNMLTEISNQLSIIANKQVNQELNKHKHV